MRKKPSEARPDRAPRRRNCQRTLGVYQRVNRITAADRSRRSSLYSVKWTNIPYPTNWGLRFHISAHGVTTRPRALASLRMCAISSLCWSVTSHGSSLPGGIAPSPPSTRRAHRRAPSRPAGAYRGEACATTSSVTNLTARQLVARVSTTRDAVEVDVEPHAQRKGHLMKRGPHTTHRSDRASLRLRAGRRDSLPDHGDPRTPPKPLCRTHERGGARDDAPAYQPG